MKTPASTQILVAGGGFVGASFALASAGMGFDTLLLDASASPPSGSQDPRASMLSSSSLQLLKRLGALEGMESLLQPVEKMIVSHGSRDGGCSPFFLTFPREKARRDAPLAYMIENRHLRKGLERAMRNCKRLRRHAPARVIRCETPRRNRIEAHLEGGGSIGARLCIAADGANSQLRADAGIETTGWHYESHALTAVLAHEREHHGVAQEHFLPSGPFAMLPLPGQRSSIVWLEAPQATDVLVRCDEKIFLREAERRMGGRYGKLSLESERLSYPVRLQLARRYGAQGLLLAGDAAHVVHPLAGQGLNMGLQDVIALEELLEEGMRLGLAPDSLALLERYERKRRFDNLAMAAVTDRTHRLFHGEGGFLRILRDVCLGTVQASPWIRALGERLAGARNSDYRSA